jgi:hypothetical protein
MQMPYEITNNKYIRAQSNVLLMKKKNANYLEKLQITLEDSTCSEIFWNSVETQERASHQEIQLSPTKNWQIIFEGEPTSTT